MIEEILIPLEEEGTTVYRPVPALKIHLNVYKVLGENIYNPKDEVWAFEPGQIVEVTEKLFDGIALQVANKIHPSKEE